LFLFRVGGGGGEKRERERERPTTTKNPKTKNAPASTTATIASADRIDDTTAAIIRSSKRDRCSRTIPGVSKSTIWWSGPEARPTILCRVV
jgi:hypothetical protein